MDTEKKDFLAPDAPDLTWVSKYFTYVEVVITITYWIIGIDGTRYLV